MLKPFTTRLPADTILALKVYTARTGGNVQAVIGAAVADYLKAHDKEGK